MTLQNIATKMPVIHFFGMLIVSVGVFFFFSNLASYLGILEKITISNPVYWFGLFATLVVVTFIPPLFIKGTMPRSFVKNPIFIWIISYLIILVIRYVTTANSIEVDAIFQVRIIGIMVLAVFLFSFSQGSYIQLWARRVILISILFAVAFNIWEVFHPSSFVPISFFAATPGRSAGLYINPNQAGAALVLGMILTITLIPQRLRLLFIFYILSGVILTFSRSMSLGWLIAVVVMWQQKVIKLSNFILLATIFLLATYSFLPDILYYIKIHYGIFAEEGIYRRMSWFAHPMFDIDMSEIERKYVANLSWQMFLDKPLLGNGIGSTSIWTERVSTHNMYLLAMADHGIIGVFIYPLFVLSSVWRAQGEIRKIVMPMAIFALFWGFFSHNIFEEYYALISFSLIAAMSYQSRTE